MQNVNYYQLIIQYRPFIEKLLLKNLPRTRETTIIVEELWEKCLVKLIKKVDDYWTGMPRTHLMEIFKSVARDVKWDYFRSEAHRQRLRIKEEGFSGISSFYHSRSLYELYEQKELFNSIVEVFPMSDLEFMYVALLQGKTYKEVAEIYSTTPAAIKMKILRVRTKARMKYEIKSMKESRDMLSRLDTTGPLWSILMSNESETLEKIMEVTKHKPDNHSSFWNTSKMKTKES